MILSKENEKLLAYIYSNINLKVGLFSIPTFNIYAHLLAIFNTINAIFDLTNLLVTDEESKKNLLITSTVLNILSLFAVLVHKIITDKDLKPDQKQAILSCQRLIRKIRFLTFSNDVVSKEIQELKVQNVVESYHDLLETLPNVSDKTIEKYKKRIEDINLDKIS